MEQIAKKQPQGSPRHLPRGGRPTDVEGMAFVSLRAMTMIEMAQVMKILEVEGIKDVKLARVRLSRTDAKRMAAGHGAAIQATIMPDDAEHENETSEQALERALHDAKARGDAVKQELLADPEMLSTAGIAERLGMSGEGVRLKHKRHEVLGVNFAKRGIRYPGWQVLENRQLLPALPQIFSILGDNPWGVYRFLLQSHPELGGSRALDALKRGRIDEVLAAATTVATGAFS
ncbi:MAG TPA: hypothetical protein VK558_15975 [Patescibacteria group bacterium]|nr:hypothetical protein [Patescibacteria group bacterium]